MAADGPRRTALFVYGTLKRGFTNYERYLGVAETAGKATFMGEATTVTAYPAVVHPARTRAPVLMDCPGRGHCIAGEIFEVDDDTLEAMDILEGVKAGNYHQKEIAVCKEGDQEEV